MPTKKIKVQITGDTSGLEASVAKARKIVAGIGEVNASRPSLPSSPAQNQVKQALSNKSSSQKKVEKERAATHKAEVARVNSRVKDIRAQIKHEKELAKAIKDRINIESSQVRRAGGGRFNRTQATGHQPQERKDIESRTGPLLPGGLNTKVSSMTMSSLAKGAAMALGTVLVSAVSAAVGMVVSTIQSGYQQYMAYGSARAGLAGMGEFSGSVHDLGMAQGSTKGPFRRSEMLGFDAAQTTQHARSVGRSTGNLNAVFRAQAAARSFGGDVTDVGGFMGTLTRAGRRFEGADGSQGGGAKTLNRILAHAVASGLDRSRTSEYLNTVASATEEASRRTARDVDSSKFSSLLALLGKRGGAGWQGARGMANLTAVDSAMRSAGTLSADADVSRVLAYQAMGFGVPNSSVSFIDATSRLQQGVFGEGGVQNFRDYYRRFAGADNALNEEETLNMSAVTQLPIRIVESLSEIMERGGTDAELQAILDQNKPVEQQMAEAAGESLKVAVRMAELANRQIAIGNQSKDALWMLQDTSNALVNKLLPTALRALENIARFVKLIWEWLPGGDNASDRRMAEVESATVALSQTKTAIHTDEVSPLAAFAAMRDAHKTIDRTLQVMSRETDSRRKAFVEQSMERQRVRLRSYPGVIARNAEVDVQEFLEENSGRPLGDVSTAQRTAAIQDQAAVDLHRDGRLTMQNLEARVSEVQDAVRRMPSDTVISPAVIRGTVAQANSAETVSTTTPSSNGGN